MSKIVLKKGNNSSTFENQSFDVENAPARPVEFRYADPPKAGFNRASAFPVVRLRRTGLASELQ
jgi:hypothetical protein